MEAGPVGEPGLMGGVTTEGQGLGQGLKVISRLWEWSLWFKVMEAGPVGECPVLDGGGRGFNSACG